MKKALLFVSLVMAAAFAAGQATVLIQDTLFNAYSASNAGVAAATTCDVNVSWQPFTSPDGFPIVRGNTTIHIVNGIVSVSLVPNQGAAPAGTSYLAAFSCANGSSYSEYWTVPSTGPTTVQAIRTSPKPIPALYFGVDGQGFNWRFAWSGATTYKAYDTVSYNGSSYLAVAGSTNIAPGTDPTRWSLMAQAGAAGGGNPAGADGNVQDNASGAFGAIANNTSATPMALHQSSANGGRGQWLQNTFAELYGVATLGQMPSGLGLTANPLSQFASTSSVQLRGIISDPTGTGALVFGTSPTITTPNILTGFTIGGAAATGHYARGNGTNYVDGTIQAGDVPTLNQNTTGLAGTATALASTPTQCGANNFATGIAASGNANCAQPALSGITGTVQAAQFPALTGDITTPGGSLTTTLPNIVSGATNTKITYNAKGQVTAGAALVSGDIPNNAANTTGNADTATSLAATPTKCSAGFHPLGVDAQGNAVNCTADGGGGGSAVTCTTFTLSSAQILTLVDSPVQLVAGTAGTVITPLSLYINYVAGSIPYGVANAQFQFALGTNVNIVTGNVFLDMFGALTNAFESSAASFYGNGQNADTASTIAQPLFLTLNGGQPDGYGVPSTTTLNTPGTGYAPGDTGTVNCSGGASVDYTIATVDGGGGVLTYTLGATTFAPPPVGGCPVENHATTSVATGGGDGAFQINITAVTPGNGTATGSVCYRKETAQ